MDNNDLLIRLRYALDIKNTDMVEIFKLGGVDVSKAEVLKLLTKTNDSDEEEVENDDNIKCNNNMLDSFLNGLIIFKRGKQESKPGQEESSNSKIMKSGSINNLVLKKVKIALSLTSEDIIEILASVGVSITKGELGALLRKEGHKNYKECGDKYARNFLKGLALKYRG